MSKASNDGPAFPCSTWITDGDGVEIGTPVTGMSKRELIAAMAMQGLIAGVGNEGMVQYDEKQVAVSARKMADELLKELEK